MLRMFAVYFFLSTVPVYVFYETRVVKIVREEEQSIVHSSSFLKKKCKKFFFLIVIYLKNETFFNSEFLISQVIFISSSV